MPDTWITIDCARCGGTGSNEEETDFCSTCGGEGTFSVPIESVHAVS